MSELYRTATVACLACNVEQEIRYRVSADPAERFACVSCGKRSVRAPKAQAQKTGDARDPVKPWALSQTDREMLTRLRVTPA